MSTNSPRTFAWLLSLFVCFGVVQGAAAQEALSLAPEARTYLTSALDTMQAHSMYRDSVDWDRLRTEALRRADGAQTPSDTYSALRYALDQLDDHSGLMGAERAADWANRNAGPDTAEVGPPPKDRLLEDAFGYVRVPMMNTGDEAIKTARADSVQTIIARVDLQSPCGWIVDLRGNRGGNMWPMLAGLGPLLGEGPVGAFVSPDGETTSWVYEDGRAKIEGATENAKQAAVRGEAYRLSRTTPPVAVLVGEETASSGEAVLIAFQGRSNTRIFGTSTKGLTTANGMFELRDGARMFLATSAMADRTGTPYTGRISPDVRVEGTGQEDKTNLAGDPVVAAATAWLKKQDVCRPSSRPWRGEMKRAKILCPGVPVPPTNALVGARLRT